MTKYLVTKETMHALVDAIYGDSEHEPLDDFMFGTYRQNRDTIDFHRQLVMQRIRIKFDLPDDWRLTKQDVGTPLYEWGLLTPNIVRAIQQFIGEID